MQLGTEEAPADEPPAQLEALREAQRVPGAAQRDLDGPVAQH